MPGTLLGMCYNRLVLVFCGFFFSTSRKEFLGLHVYWALKTKVMSFQGFQSVSLGSRVAARSMVRMGIRTDKATFTSIVISGPGGIQQGLEASARVYEYE